MSRAREGLPRRQRLHAGTCNRYTPITRKCSESDADMVMQGTAVTAIS
jgi:hypothetical protein